MDTDFYRIRRLPPYVFAEVNAMKAAARAQRRGHDRPRHGQSRRRAAQACHRQARRGREQAQRPPLFGQPRHSGAAEGAGGLLPAPLRRRLDPETEVIVTLGSKEGLANLAQAITAPGDVVLAPNPSYPIHSFGFIIAGAAVRSIPAAPGEEFFERLDQCDALHRAAARRCW